MNKKIQQGQSALEYILFFAIVVAVLVVAVLSQEGFFYKALDSSLDTSFEGIECMAAKVCHEQGNCPDPCGDGCCMPGEESSCPQDCFEGECIRDPALAPCQEDSCGEGCEIVYQRLKKEEWGFPIWVIVPHCQEIPCTGQTKDTCESHCVWMGE